MNICHKLCYYLAVLIWGENAVWEYKKIRPHSPVKEEEVDELDWVL